MTLPPHPYDVTFRELAADLGAGHLFPTATEDPPTERLPTPYPRRGGQHRWRTPEESVTTQMTQPEHVQSGHPAHKLGRLPEQPERPRLRLGDFLREEYKGEVPDLVDYSATNAIDGWPMFLNDQLGSCTAADAGHAVRVWTAWGQGAPATITDEDILAFYSGSSGYRPEDPSTDQGATMQEVNDYFRKVGMAGRTIEAFFRVDTDDLDEIRAALYLFGTVSVGMAFPGFAMDQFLAGHVWHVPSVAPRNSRIEGGHDVLLVGARKGGNLLVVTWGRLQEVTPRFWAQYMSGRNYGEAWARVETDWASKAGIAPGNALRVEQLNDAFHQLTGQPGPFPVAPPDPPRPEVGPENRREIIRSVAEDLARAADGLRQLADTFAEER